jgi:glyoxylase-like metal-dependent hydrolase (beta-lactamase superfamily II)
MIEVARFVFNPFSENTYLIWDTSTRETMVIDPGFSDSFEEEELSDFIQDKKLLIKYLIATHCHVDHVLGVNYIKNKYNPVFLAPELDMPLLKMVDQQGKAFGISCPKPVMPDLFLSERSNLEIGNSDIFPLFTPGHSPGEHCIYFKNEAFVIAGDVLFYRSIGRTDLWDGNYSDLISSVKNRLFTLPDDTIVYPGHGEETTIGSEKKENPFVKE